ncbi:MAG: hypothetical protein LBK82_15990 [Planctomycetaceae bacterium]|nr:hypothetical protein [Planctomycetaceae bacterium]
MFQLRCILAVMLFGNTRDVFAQITRIWLSHRTNYPSHIVINWESSTPGHSEVYFYIEPDNNYRVIKEEDTTLHHVEIPLKYHDVQYHYHVKTGSEQSETYTFKSYPSSQHELRIAFVGNWLASPNHDLSKLIEDAPHLLFSLGDNIRNLHQSCGVGVTDCIEPFLKLIDHYPNLFRSTPFMSVLGNHDKEIRPRGNRPPSESVYDLNVTAYRKFIELPDDEWKWEFGIPDFHIYFVGLDLNHTSDFNTTWQSCHDFHKNSEQFNWYKTVMETRSKGYTITLNNEKNNNVRVLEQGLWQELLEKGNAVITGFGHFAEYAEVNGCSYFNTSLTSAGTLRPDPHSKFIKQKESYILLRCTNKNPLSLEIKQLDGTIINTTIFNPVSNEFF